MKHASLVIVALGLVAGGCSRFDSAHISPVAHATAAEAPKLVVYKNATCGCCGLWVEHMRKAGFAAEVHDVDNMSPIKERVGVPYSMGSCHTAQVGGYFVEGHVPAEQVLRLLKEKPKAKGLTVPAMPIGSPGMEQGDTKQPYEVHLVNQDGTTTVYARYPK
jgi:hypothetical protein